MKEARPVAKKKMTSTDGLVEWPVVTVFAKEMHVHIFIEGGFIENATVRFIGPYEIAIDVERRVIFEDMQGSSDFGDAVVTRFRALPVAIDMSITPVLTTTNNGIQAVLGRTVVAQSGSLKRKAVTSVPITSYMSRR